MNNLPVEPSDSAPLLALADQDLVGQDQILLRARAFAEPLLAGEVLDSGENVLDHADALAVLLQQIGGSPALQAASYLVYACHHLAKPQEVIAKAFGENLATLALETTKLVGLQRQTRLNQLDGSRGATSIPLAHTPAQQTESVRKMLLAFSRDLRVVMLRLASRLQTLRYFASAKLAPPQALVRESLQVFAPLANRLGIREIKWELEDLSFRFLEPQTYHQVARLLQQTRAQREVQVERLRSRLQTELRMQGIAASVQGRPKHIYSIVKKMRGKSLGFEQVYDLLALRILVPSVPDCYAALSWVHSQFSLVSNEFDDYIAKPKPNGYQSLHSIVSDEVGHTIEVQIRTQAMHDHAEMGGAAHWAYKESGVKGYSGAVSSTGVYDAKLAVLRQLLAWQRDLAGTAAAGVLDDKIYVLTPDAAIVELPQGATAIDFAYSVHTNLGHRCRGARLDGVMMPLNTALRNGQTVEISVVKEGGPSRDWLNPELGFLVSHRAKSKVRAWFNALALKETISKGRELVEKLLQRLGKTAISHDALAEQLDFKTADGLFESVGKDEYSLRNIEALLRPPEAAPADADLLLKKPRSKPGGGQGGLLVVGVDSLMTQLARCCKPAPPDPICGFVTRGKGVSVHRSDCSNLREMVSRSAERVIEVAWAQARAPEAVYPVDVAIQAHDRQGLLRDITEVFTKEKMNLIGAQTQSIKGTAWMTFTVEVPDAGRLQKVLALVAELKGVRSARRR